MDWLVYIIECSDKTFYTGITTDLERRYEQHAKQVGAKYFRGRQPVRVVYVERGHDRSTASAREYEIKQLSRGQKQALLCSVRNELG